MKDWIFIGVLFLLLCLCGCSLHFKGEKIEMDTETKEMTKNTTYDLEKADLF